MATISQSFTGAEEVAKQFPQAQADQLVAAAQQAFVDGKTAAILFAVIASLIGLVLVLLLYPNKRDEEATYARVAGQPQPRRDAEPEPEPDPGARAAEPDAPPLSWPRPWRPGRPRSSRWTPPTCPRLARPGR